MSRHRRPAMQRLPNHGRVCLSIFRTVFEKGAGRIPAKDVVAPSDADHAATVLEDSLGATLLHKNLKAEIETPIAEVKALR